ncbi:MAG: T9SS type A sorting domain-containing protein, partial [Ekhidna sp.]|nr:T9SS type A sorting domain-containing protein [Ekhidna sp.]
TITVNDLDEDAPVFTSATTAAIDENLPATALVYTATATDASTLTYSLSGTDAASFTLDGTTGELTLDASPDFETQDTYEVTITATDTEGNAADLTLTITVNDLDEDAPVFTSGNAISLAENTEVGTVIYTATVTDAGTVTYDMTGADVTFFSIDSSTGALTNDLSPDFESPVDDNGDNVYELTIIATDAAGNSTDQPLAITVTDENEDTIRPTVTIATTATDPTNASVIPVTIAFSEDVTGFTIEDLTVTNGTLANFTTVDASNYTVDLVPLADGQITMDIAAGVAQDGAGNDNLAAVQFTITSDRSAPSVTIATTVADPTNASVIPVTITFSEDVIGFEEADITITNGTLSGFTATDAATYTVNVSPLADGELRVSIAAGVATDPNGNGNTAASALTLIYDGTAPVVTVDIYGTSISSPQLTGTVDDNGATIAVTVAGNSYPAVNDGDGTWSLAAGTIAPGLADDTYDVIATATDAVGNVGTDNTSDELTISQTVVALIATDIRATSFQANWSEGLDVQNYELDVSTESDFSTFVSGYESREAASTSLTITDLDFSQNYYYRVRLVNTSSEVSGNSNTTRTKTTVDATTLADSLALTQIFDAVNPQGLNWTTARLRDWDGVTLGSTRTRVNVVNIASTQAQGAMPNPFTGAAQTEGGLSAMTAMDVSENQLTALIDYTGTNISTLFVNMNSLTFEDLEPLTAQESITDLDYADQASVRYNQATEDNEPIKIPHLSSYQLSIGTGGMGIGGSANTYTWYQNDTDITTGNTAYTIDGPTGEITSIDFESMGMFRTEITNSLVPNLTIEVEPQTVFATADVRVALNDDQGDVISGETFDAALMETVRTSVGFDTLESVLSVSSEFVFEEVVLGNYLSGIDPTNQDPYLPTYFSDEIQWEEADTIFLRANTEIGITMAQVPPPLGDGDGDGEVDVVIEEDFGDENTRIDARRRAAKRKCGLRRKRSGGRVDQDDDEFELIAYGETDDNGEFKFGFLPAGTYRFFVEYPGIPLDESSEVEFEVGETGISDTDFKLEVFASEDGIAVTIDPVLGVIFEYFKDLQVYPNPSTDYLKIRYRHLKSQDVRVDLIDLAGNTMWRQDLRNGFDGELRIDVKDYDAGVYLLRFYDKEGRSENVVTYRIMVNR